MDSKKVASGVYPHACHMLTNPIDKCLFLCFLFVLEIHNRLPTCLKTYNFFKSSLINNRVHFEYGKVTNAILNWFWSFDLYPLTLSCVCVVILTFKSKKIYLILRPILHNNSLNSPFKFSAKKMVLHTNESHID